MMNKKCMRPQDIDEREIKQKTEVNIVFSKKEENQGVDK